LFIDTHSHLDFPQFDGDIEDVVARAVDSGVERIINIGTSLESSQKVVEISERFECCYAAVGVHPHDAKEVDDNCLSEIEKLGRHEKVVAVGEIGLDYYRNHSPRENQAEVFEKQLGLAQTLELPVVVHARDATSQCLAILEKHPGLTGVMHCFSSNSQNARRAFELGFYVSCCGQITYPNAENLREKFREIGHDRFMLETDAPFLAPQQHRGKRNEPAYIPLIAQTYAELFGISIVELENISTANARKLFGI